MLRVEAFERNMKSAGFKEFDDAGSAQVEILTCLCQQVERVADELEKNREMFGKLITHDGVYLDVKVRNGDSSLSVDVL